MFTDVHGVTFLLDGGWRVSGSPVPLAFFTEQRELALAASIAFGVDPESRLGDAEPLPQPTYIQSHPQGGSTE